MGMNRVAASDCKLGLNGFRLVAKSSHIRMYKQQYPATPTVGWRLVLTIGPVQGVPAISRVSIAVLTMIVTCRTHR